MKHPENDPTALDPDEPREHDLPAKPPIQDMPPEEGEDPPAHHQEQDVHDDEYLPDQQAAEDPTIDDKEHDR